MVPNVPTCETDTQRVEQILVNLLTNAVRHAPRGSVVDVHFQGCLPSLYHELATEPAGCVIERGGNRP